MTVVRLRNHPFMAESLLTASRANRDGIVDIGADEDAERRRADELMEKALRSYRTAYGSNTLAELLECRLDVEQRLIRRELERAAR